jgi:hypothetical protein
MDKSRHPLVIQPWKIQRGQQTKWESKREKTGMVGSKAPGMLLGKRIRDGFKKTV